MKACYRCGTPWVSEKKQPGVKEYCTKCSAYLHCCLNCRYHDPSRPNQCVISTTEWVGDRAGANFCDEFEFRDREESGRSEEERRRAVDMLDQLFGGAAQEAGEDTARRVRSLDDLFGGG